CSGPGGSRELGSSVPPGEYVGTVHLTRSARFSFVTDPARPGRRRPTVGRPPSRAGTTADQPGRRSRRRANGTTPSVAGRADPDAPAPATPNWPAPPTCQTRRPARRLVA